MLDWCDRATEIGLSGIALPEIISAFCRLRRKGRIGDWQYRQLESLLLADIEDAAICDLTPAVLAHAIASLESNALRAMDAILTGSALGPASRCFHHRRPATGECCQPRRFARGSGVVLHLYKPGWRWANIVPHRLAKFRDGKDRIAAARLPSASDGPSLPF